MNTVDYTEERCFLQDISIQPAAGLAARVPEACCPKVQTCSGFNLKR